MRLIYLQAEAVVVWLGPSSDDSELAMQWIDEFGTRACDLDIGTTPELQLRQLIQGAEAKTEKDNVKVKFFQDLNERLSITAGRRSLCSWNNGW